jgi:hypothetical protein
MPRNTLKFETPPLERMIKRLEELGGDVKTATADALQQAAERIRDNTIDALNSSNLPAHGQYSTGATLKSVADVEPAKWEGTVASVPVGFDFSKPGAGGYLISGTPKMRPDPALHKMYKQKKYMESVQDDMASVVFRYIMERMEK